MAIKGFHITEDGSIQQCRNRNRCKLGDHWAEAEHVRIHLDNIAYLGEIDAKVKDFNAIATDPRHPQHFRAFFSPDLRHASARKFGDEMEHYVAQNGSRPSYLQANMRYVLKFLPNVDLRVEIETKPVIDAEYGRVTRQWTATVLQYKDVISAREYHLPKKAAHEKVVKTLDLDFSGHGSGMDETIDRLEGLFEFAVRTSDPLRGRGLVASPYAEEVKGMMDRFMEMFNAIEGAARTDVELFYEGHGYFKDSVENTVIVDVAYRRSTFGPQSFRDFVRSNYYYQGETIDAEIRVTDSIGMGDAPASWSLYCKDGVWRVATVCWDGRAFDTVATNAEEVRGHVYWQMMNEVMPNKQEEAFKVSQYAADLFTMVESELAHHNG